MLVPPLRSERVRDDRQTALCVDVGDSLLSGATRLDERGRPQAEDMSFSAFDLLADDDLDAIAVCDSRGLEGTLVRVVIADGDHGKVGRLRCPFEYLSGRRGPVGRGRVDVQVGCGEWVTHGVRMVAPAWAGWVTLSALT